MRRPFQACDAVTLSTEAQWNQTEEDWRRLLRLCPQGCFAIHEAGELASTATAVTYGRRLGWIGMVLTREKHRGKGFARRLLHQALEFLDQEKVECVKLDATALGRPLYLDLGFVDERPVSRWRRPAGEALPPAHQVRGEIFASLFALDEEAFGADRSALLRELAREEVYAIADAGFAFARPGRTAYYFGPCVARDPLVASQLLCAFLSRHGNEDAMLDLCDEHADAAQMARAAGFRPVRNLMRMRRGDASHARLGSGPWIYALAGFEYG